MSLIDELYTFYNTKPRILDLTNGRLPAVHMVTKPIIASHQLPCNTSIDRVRLVKQVLRLFPAFNYFIRHLPSIKWMHGRGHFNTARSERLPKKTKGTGYKRTTQKTERFIYKRKWANA